MKWMYLHYFAKHTHTQNPVEFPREDVERILVIVLKWIYGTSGDMWIVRVFVSLLPTKHRRAFWFVCAYSSYKNL